ncbi:MAG: acyl-CoA/acyl-ACP dehydrogenase [Chloroflexi bacterium]|nr:acyl-CoA/acyl-ACP dehydrogenase [Chloroflexota bacterium]
MDFRLNEEQLMTQQLFREFAQKEVKPLSRILDAKPDPIDCLSWDLVKKASDLGIRTLAIPRELGGLAADIISRLIIQEELGAADIGFADLMRGHGSALLKLTKEQQDEFLPQYLADYRFFTASAGTEPDHGTDQQMGCEEPQASIQTLAEKHGDEYIINGRKQFISHGGIARLYFVHCRTDRTSPIRKAAASFLVPSDTPGVSTGKFHNKLGRRLLINGEIIFDNVRVPASYLIKEGWTESQEDQASPGFVAMAGIVGLMRAIQEETLSYAAARVQGGKPIIQHGTVAAKLGEMDARVQAARALLWQAAWCRANKYNYHPKMWLLTKGFVNQVSLDVVNKAVDIHGGMGTDKDMPIEKYLRDVYSTLHGFSTGEIGFIRATLGL